MSDGPGYEANFQRGQLLRESGRYEEACRFLADAIAANPNESQAYLELALAESGRPGRKEQSLAAMDRAVSLSPNSAYYQGYRAYLQTRFGRHKVAEASAQNALKLDPNCHIALLGLANAQTKMGQWLFAELTARRMLQMNANDTVALNLLAQALRFRDKLHEAREVTRQILARVPNDVFGQANAGYEALEVGDHRRANVHFLNALRIDPHYEHARKGLLQSLRARNFLYRLNMKFINTYGSRSNLSGAMRLLLVFLMISTGGAVMFLWLLYIMVALTLQPISNFFLLTEPMGRRALTTKERNWAIFNGVVMFGLLAVLALTRLYPLLYIVGGYFLLFALGVYGPQWIDGWRARREEKMLAKPIVP